MAAPDYEAWRCPTRDQHPDGPSVFCPSEGCPEQIVFFGQHTPAGCARDLGWAPGDGDKYPEHLAHLIAVLDGHAAPI